MKRYKQALQHLKIRIKNRDFGYICKRILWIFLPQIPDTFHIQHRFLYNIFVFPQWTKYLKVPNDYSYIIAGSHGVGFAAFIKLCEQIRANPMPLDHLYFSTDPLLLMKKHAKKHKNSLYGLSLEKAYTDPHRKHILEKLQHRVPVFCLLRDPISILRTHTHPSLLPLIAATLKAAINPNGGGGRHKE
ncbi:hypothetical protein BKH46_06995 [Helicobacter sp. 12S02634-8]|uniref:hypothetical protein n=1 Tax=Helicobacter sp. 12S02634-8 TaxID=1476199 RepID=UPI000BA6E21D|nr:hypothetical protein [Helicobacter sp. 12S02634-8]PAF46703.1 hypothetical protein BKH46_06995 [Helicobacter sp. 12S02634-8]